MKSGSTFPEVDLRELLIAWEKCFSVEPGLVEAKTVSVMEANQWDFAPVFDKTTTPQLVGLIPRTRLQELNFCSNKLSADDNAIVRPEIQDRIRMDDLLERMQTTLATIVVNSDDADGKQALGLFTRADLNRHPFRSEIYFALAHLESELAKLIRRSFDDPWDWLDLLSEEKQARIVGYWKISKRRGVDHGPVGAAMLTGKSYGVTH